MTVVAGRSDLARPPGQSSVDNKNDAAEAADPLDALLAKLNQGDPAAAEAVFRSYEPYLRMVVRRQLSESMRAKLDSMDIVQSVWADVLEGFRQAAWSFPDSAHLRAFLAKAASRRLIDRFRQHRKALERERPCASGDLDLLASAHSTRPSAVAQADELWQQMLDVCPEAHRDVLRLKRQGLALDDIAAQSGLHKSSVRRILYDLARRLTLRRTTPAQRAEDTPDAGR